MKIHHGIPELIGIGKFDENKYIYAVCRCPLPYGYAIKIPWNDLTEHEKETGACHVHCDNCGTDSTICFRPRVEGQKELLGRRANIVRIDEFFWYQK